MKKYLIEFECVIGDYEHSRLLHFDTRKKVNGDTAKNFGEFDKRDNSCLSDNQFWDNHSQNAISVNNEIEITNEEAKVLERLMIAWKYNYTYEDYSQDTRSFEIESEVKLTQEEIQDIALGCTLTAATHIEVVKRIRKAKFIGTEYGVDTQCEYGGDEIIEESEDE